MLSLKKSDIDLAKKFVADLGETSTTNDAGKDDGNGVTWNFTLFTILFLCLIVIFLFFHIQYGATMLVFNFELIHINQHISHNSVTHTHAYAHTRKHTHAHIPTHLLCN